MSDTDLDKPWETLEQLVEKDSPKQIEAFLEELPGSDVVLTMSRLSEEVQSQVLNVLTPEHAAEVIDQMPNIQATVVIELLEPPTAAAILQELPSNEKVDLLCGLPEANAQAILEEMDPTEVTELRSLIQYPANVAGGLMLW